MANCDKGCYEVGSILYGEDYEGCEDAEEKQGDILTRYEAYNAIWPGDYGHTNYALASYCVDVGHIECLKKLHGNVELQWHNDLADCVIEKDNLECLKFVVEVMGDVEIKCKDKKLGRNCRKYVRGLGARVIDKIEK